MKKKWLLVLGVLVLLGLGAFYYGYNTLLKSNTGFEEKEVELKIPSNSSYSTVYDLLVNNKIIKDRTAFSLVAQWMKYKGDKVPAGRYIIKKGMSNRSLITKLRSGDQDPMKLTINNIRTLPELAGALSTYIETDSLTILNYISDTSVMAKLGKNPFTMMTAFLPDTYEAFWTDKPDKVVDRLANHSKSFFDKNNDKLKAIGMTAEQAYTLASIVDKESNLVPEKPRIAGVYHNRLKIGEKLRADPTVVFALQDFSIRRVLNVHLVYDSPYNTYMYAGLPPGPICMPEMSSIKAVLSPEQNNYLFFCAKPGYNAGHLFAQTYDEHLKNAAIYQNWLNSEGIK